MISENPAAHFKYLKRETTNPETPTWEAFKIIVADIRPQTFNADAKDSGDFVEFIGLAGLGQAEALRRAARFGFRAGQMIMFRHKTRTGFACRFTRSFDCFWNV